MRNCLKEEEGGGGGERPVWCFSVCVESLMAKGVTRRGLMGGLS